MNAAGRMIVVSIGSARTWSSIYAAATQRSDISRRSTTNTGIRQRQAIPTHANLPPCSRPSRTAPGRGRS